MVEAIIAIVFLLIFLGMIVYGAIDPKDQNYK